MLMTIMINNVLSWLDCHDEQLLCKVRGCYPGYRSYQFVGLLFFLKKQKRGENFWAMQINFYKKLQIKIMICSFKQFTKWFCSLIRPADSFFCYIFSLTTVKRVFFRVELRHLHG